MLFYSNFNSIKVRLELNITDPTLYSDASFQFHKGTIRTPLLFLALVLCLDFNSIKVRLEHVDFASQVYAHLFQFHKGTIRTSQAY